MRTNTHFIEYTLMFYGKNGIYELRKNGKALTKPTVTKLMPELQREMIAQGWDFGGGDSMDREFFRNEVLEPLGYTQTN